MKPPPPKATADGDDWTEEATDHDALVVDILLNLKYSARRPAASRSVTAKSVANLDWGVKQPRSASAVSGSKSKERIGRRCSPSTPLSWSGGSGGVEGCSLVMNRSPVSRSKINLDGGAVRGASSSKLRKKKTYLKLVEEETILLKESMYLDKELVMLGGTASEQYVENENLKNIKLDLINKLTNNDMCAADVASGSRDAASRQAVMKAEAYDYVPSTLSLCRSKPSTNSCKAKCDASTTQKRAKFLLPDLNMMPSEMDSTS